jgi:hypothetical protein
MRVKRSLALATLAGSLGCASMCAAQQVIYDNTLTSLGFFSGSVEAGAANGHERGDEITFGGVSREVSEIRILYTSAAGAGNADVQVRLYQTGTSAPGPVIWESSVLPGVPHLAGNNELVVPVPNVIVPEQLIWTFQFTNRTGSTGAMGPRLFDPPAIGTSENHFWAKDAPNFPGWARLWFGGSPVANFGAKFTATGTLLTGACCLPNGSCDTLTAGQCAQQQGLYQGDNTPCGSVICRDPGACCLRDGSCLLTAEHVCTAQGGTFRGDGVACGPAANCPQPGASCLPDNSCVIASEAQATAAGGTFSGAGTICGVVTCWQSPVLFNNGPLSTGEFSSTFLQAPAGTTWSEFQTEPGCVPNIFGYGIVGAARLADQFTISGQAWNIQKVEVFAYQTRTENVPTPPASPFTAATLRIWNGRPGTPGATVVWGDTTTNLLTSSTFANIWRVSNGAPVASQFQRPVFRNELTLNANLAPGTYWVDYNLTTATGGAFAPPVTVMMTRGIDGANAVQQTVANGPWDFIVDAGTCNIPRRQDIPFIIYGTTGTVPCYANCDGSTTPPILNVEDFTCFINQFAAGTQLPHSQQLTHYANCDQSTTAPVLNVEDFTCFINRFAQGCN